MEILAHGLWTAAGVVAARRATVARVSLPWTVWWGAFPDVLGFGPSVVAGLALWLVRGHDALAHGHPHVHLGLALYPAAHSLIVFALVFTVTAIAARRIVYPLLGWLLHILIDIPTHSFSYYATRFLWPVSDYRVDGVAWWTPSLWISTYAALAVAYGVMWRKGWFRVRDAPDPSRSHRQFPTPTVM